MTAIHVAGPYLVSLSALVKLYLQKQLAVKCIPLFKKSSDPSIVNITSLGAYFLNRSCCEFSYAQSKAAGTWKCHYLADGRGTHDQDDVCWTYAFQDPSQLYLSRYASLLVSGKALMIGLFHSNLTTDDKGNLWPPMEEATKNIPKGYVLLECK
jgi:hypothetical protein